MALQVKTSRITEDIVDGNNNIIGKISFDPSDAKTIGAFMNIYKQVVKANKELKKIGATGASGKYGKLEDLVNKNLETDEDFNNAEEYMNISSRILDITVKTVDDIREDIDVVFGNGVESVILCGGYDIDALNELINFAAPHFAKQKRDKIAPYLRK